MPAHRIAVVPFAALVLVALATPEPAAAVNRRAFVTSVSGTGNLGDWPDAGAATGLAAGNAICRKRAELGGLPNFSDYRAWLSTPAADAYCHVRGQSGEKGSCTGGTALGAGPWYLANGITNFTGTLDQLTSNSPQIYRPVSWDEFSNDLPLDIDERRYWTGTDPAGTLFNNGGFHCDSWTSDTTGSAPIGDGLGTAVTWTLGGFMPSCSSLQRLLCLEAGASDVAILGWSAGNPVFISSEGGSSDLSSWPEAGGQTGLAAGDAICRNLASAAHLPDPPSFVAWLSTSAVDAKDRVTSNGPFRRLDGYTVANNEADLIDGSLDTTIHVDEFGDYITGTPEMRTGTLANGTASGQDCLGWSSAATGDDGTGGRPNFAGVPEWTEFTLAGACGVFGQLYCISNRIVLFWDGFELTGDTSRWTSTTP